MKDSTVSIYWKQPILYNRWSVLFRSLFAWLMILLHLLALYFLGIAVKFIQTLAFFDTVYQINAPSLF